AMQPTIHQRSNIATSLLAIMGACCALCSVLATSQTVSTDPSLTPPPSFNAPFTHPGLLNNLEELNFIKERVRTNSEPWKTALSKIQSSNFADLKWIPKPRAVVDVGFFGKPDNGGSDELKDSTAAYV